MFKGLKDRHDSKTADEQDSKSSYDDMKWDFAEDEKLREILQKIISFVGINIEIIGAWIWVSGNTFQYKEYLNDIGFKWASKQKVWYFHTEAFRKKSYKVLSMKKKRDCFGSTEVETEQTKAIQA